MLLCLRCGDYETFDLICSFLVRKWALYMCVKCANFEWKLKLNENFEIAISCLHLITDVWKRHYEPSEFS